MTESASKFRLPSFKNPAFELVALHPQHLLPQPGSVLTIYDSASNLLRHYAPAPDKYLRETNGTTSDSLPTIVPPQRTGLTGVNVFLVAINAEI